MNIKALTKEFSTLLIEVINRPHVPYHCKDMFQYLQTKIQSLGFLPVECGLEHKEYNKYADSNSIYFDIPATAGCESWPSILLQAHMDMIMTFDVNKFTQVPDWTAYSPKAIIDGDYIHSEGYQSSIGADDGVGITTILLLAKYHKEFNHGPIRCLLTSDEEESSGCSKHIEKRVLAGFNNILELDGGDNFHIVKSCYGYSKMTFLKQLGLYDIPKELKTYSITIGGLLGGHSGIETNSQGANALKLASDLIWSLDTGNDLQLINLNCDYYANSIPSTITFTFATSRDYDYIQNYVINQKIAYYKTTWKSLDKLFIFLKEIPNDQKGLSHKDSQNINYLIASLPSGFYSFTDQNFNYIKSSNNIAPFYINQKNGVAFFYFETCARSSDNNSMLKMNDTVKTMVYNRFALEPKSYDIKYAWQSKYPNKLYNLVAEAYFKQGITPSPEDYTGWLECSDWAMINPDADVTATSPIVKNSHTYTECVSISSIPVFLNTILYTLENLNKIK